MAKNWKIISGIFIVLGCLILGAFIGHAIEGLISGGGIVATIFGWIFPNRKSGPGSDAAGHADAARVSANSDTSLSDANARSDNQAEKLGPILDSGKKLAGTGDNMVAGDEEFIKRAEEEIRKGHS